MSAFDFNPFEVGNPLTIGMIEESLVTEIRVLARKSHTGYNIYSKDILNLLDRYDVKYESLGQWIKDEIDMIDLVD